MARNTSSVKTLVITDLVDSTSLVDHMGDARAAEVFTAVDRATRDLIRSHNGREIDKTDGFLLLFDRPAEGLAFALAYHRRLKTLGEAHKKTLQTRTGIHVGEVFLRENSAEDIARGAKAIEVEGLAKPIAARLMAAAKGGQTLLTQAAFELAKHAFNDQQEKSEQLQWLKHGSYRLQGVTDIVEVFEVGEPGIAPLRAPERSAKARRVYFGRAKAIALGSIAICVSACVLYLSFVPKETFAFAPRDWVLIGDFTNHTQDSLLDDSLKTAFRVALEQSQFANFIPNSQIRSALQRMQRDPNDTLDRATAIEVSQREQARALINGSINEIGRSFSISAEIIDPQNGRSVMVASATAGGPSSILDALDDVTRRLRERLGESLAAIEKSSAPLSKVTTTDFEALKAYTLAEQKLWSGAVQDGLELLERAVERDPEFAMAHGKLASVYYSTKEELAKAETHWALALQNKARLTDREKIYIEASSAWMKTPADMLRGWKLMSSLYPNQQVGHHNLGIVYWNHYDNYTEAAKAFKAAIKIRYPWRQLSYSALASMNLANNMYDDAIANYRMVEELSGSSFDFKIIDALIAAQHYKEADKEILLVAKAPPGFFKQRGITRVIRAYADQGLLNKAREQNAKLIAAIPNLADNPVLSFQVDATKLALAERIGDTAQLHKLIREILTREQEKPAQAVSALSPKAIKLAIVGRIAARNGMLASAKHISASVGSQLKSSHFPVWKANAILLEAEIALQSDKPDHAIALASASLATNDIYQGHETLARAYIAAGKFSQGEKELLWMIEKRGKTFVESSDSICGCGNIFNIVDWASAHLRLARLMRTTGNHAAAASYYKKFIDHWKAADPRNPDLAAAVKELKMLPKEAEQTTQPIKKNNPPVTEGSTPTPSR